MKQVLTGGVAVRVHDEGEAGVAGGVAVRVHDEDEAGVAGGVAVRVHDEGEAGVAVCVTGGVHDGREGADPTPGSGPLCLPYPHPTLLQSLPVLR